MSIPQKSVHIAETSCALRPRPYGPCKTLAILLGIACLTMSFPSAAYIGPSTGVSAFGAAFALIAAIAFAILGFIWYPLKRIRRMLTRTRRTEPGARIPPEA